jgi:alpha-beta hydrolase superfamily lysophospholipase
MGRGTRPPRRLAATVAVAALAALAPSPAAPADVSTELVRLRTADGRSAAGVVHGPVGRAPRAGVALVHGYGSNFYSPPVEPLARALAERGFLTLAANGRDHDGGAKTSLFEESRWDEEAAVDELARRGAAPVAMIGSSLGTNRVLFYAAETQDPRVQAVGLLAGPGNAFEWNVWQLGRERATRTLAEAERLQREGRGAELMLVDLGPLGKALYSADHLVSLRGPRTRSDPYRNIGRIGVPVLLVYGTADPLVRPEVARRLRTAATQSRRVDLIEVPGADHGFSGHGAELAAIIERWLGEVLAR